MLMSVVILGVGGLGRKCHEIIEDINTIKSEFVFKGFLDGNPELKGTTVHDYRVLGGMEWCLENPDVGVVVAIGNPVTRKRIVGELIGNGVTNFPSIVHPLASISPRSRVEKGAIIAPYAIVQANARVGSFSSIGSFSVYGHDTVIGGFVSSGPHVCVVGFGEVGEGCNLGTGAVILAGASVGAWATIGANATVTKPIPNYSTAVGTPAKVINRQEPNRSQK